MYLHIYIYNYISKISESELNGFVMNIDDNKNNDNEKNYDDKISGNKINNNTTNELSIDIPINNNTINHFPQPSSTFSELDSQYSPISVNTEYNNNNNNNDNDNNDNISSSIDKCSNYLELIKEKKNIDNTIRLDTSHSKQKRYSVPSSQHEYLEKENISAVLEKNQLSSIKNDINEYSSNLCNPVSQSVSKGLLAPSSSSTSQNFSHNKLTYTSSKKPLHTQFSVHSSPSSSYATSLNFSLTCSSLTLARNNKNINHHNNNNHDQHFRHKTTFAQTKKTSPKPPSKFFSQMSSQSPLHNSQHTSPRHFAPPSSSFCIHPIESGGYITKTSDMPDKVVNSLLNVSPSLNDTTELIDCSLDNTTSFAAPNPPSHSFQRGGRPRPSKSNSKKIEGESMLEDKFI
jgi:hypothetical protein